MCSICVWYLYVVCVWGMCVCVVYVCVCGVYGV